MTAVIARIGLMPAEPCCPPVAPLDPADVDTELLRSILSRLDDVQREQLRSAAARSDQGEQLTALREQVQLLRQQVSLVATQQGTDGRTLVGILADRRIVITLASWARLGVIGAVGMVLWMFDGGLRDWVLRQFGLGP